MKITWWKIGATALVLLFFSSLLTILASNKEPEIQIISVNSKTDPVIETMPGENSYSVVIQSFSPQKKAKVTMKLINLKTNEEVIVFQNQWMININSGVFNLENGKWLLEVTAVDETGLAAEPYRIELDVGQQFEPETNLKISKIEPEYLFTFDNPEIPVKVTFKNEGPVPIGEVAVAWRWGDEEEKWQQSQLISLPSEYTNNGELVVDFTVPAAFKDDSKTARPIIFAIDYTNKINEKNEEDNEFLSQIDTGFPDLEAVKFIVEKIDNSTIIGDYLIRQKLLNGRDKPITTLVKYGTSASNIIGEESITFNPGEDIWIENVTLPKSTKVAYIHIIPVGQEKTLENNEVPFDLNLLFQRDLWIKYMTSGQFSEGDEVNTIVYVGSMEGGQELEGPVDVVLRRDGVEIARQSITMIPGEEQTVLFKWKAPDVDSMKTFKLQAEINPEPRKYEEITYENNIAESTVTVLPKFNPSMCTESSRTYITNGEHWVYTFKEGWVIASYYHEWIDTKVTPIQPTTVKAGMGFQFSVSGEYGTSNPYITERHYNYNNVVADFLEQELEFIETKGPGRSKIWYPPRAKIAVGQGDLEMIEYKNTMSALDPQNLYRDEFTDGGNRLYTSFYQKDGLHPFKVEAFGGGSRKYTVDREGELKRIEGNKDIYFCRDLSVEIKGSPYDDYVWRKVDPYNPFPQDGRHGWNWEGWEDYFAEIAPWYYSYGKENKHMTTTHFKYQPK
ncbi:MAG TPA: hypothetical protein GXX18_06240 [Bacillales bacterium]|nr:hypothetical protein [Bacillales bacterium]